MRSTCNAACTNNAMHTNPEPPKTEPVSATLEAARNQMVQTRRLLQELARQNPQWAERIEPTAGLLTCGIVTLYVSREEIIKHEIKVTDQERGQSYRFAPRGTGLDACPGCFVCGADKRNPEANNNYLNNIAAFVASRADGEAVMAWFASERGPGAWLDYRPHEPHRIQLKIGACDAHLPQLQALYALTRVYGVIRQRDIVDACAGVQAVAASAPDAKE